MKNFLLFRRKRGKGAILIVRESFGHKIPKKGNWKCRLKLEHFASATRYQFRAGLKAKDVADLVDARGNVKYARRTGWLA